MDNGHHHELQSVRPSDKRTDDEPRRLLSYLLRWTLPLEPTIQRGARPRWRPRTAGKRPAGDWAPSRGECGRGNRAKVRPLHWRAANLATRPSERYSSSIRSSSAQGSKGAVRNVIGGELPGSSLEGSHLSPSRPDIRRRAGACSRSVRGPFPGDCEKLDGRCCRNC